MDCSMPSFPVPHHLLKSAQVHVHCISDAIQPSHPLMPSSPSSLIFTQISDFSDESTICISSVHFSRSVMSDSLWSHGLQHARLPCPSPTPRACSNSCPSSRWCHTTISSSVFRFSSCLQSFPASGSFQMSQFFASGGQIIGALASVSVPPMSNQDWFSLGWIGLISLQSNGLSRVFSNTTVSKHQSFSSQLFYGPTLISIHDYWKNHSFDQMDLCQQSNVSAF